MPTRSPRAAAALIAAEARAAVAARGRFTFAVSGGRTPWQMLRAARARRRALGAACTCCRWTSASRPPGDPIATSRTCARACSTHAPLPSRAGPRDAGRAPDLAVAAARYAATLARIAGSPPVLDLVHLGLGPDGHTASLVPGDPVLDVVDADVAVTAVYQGRRRMTLTYPMLDRARRVLWLVTGAEKAAMLARLRAGDPVDSGRAGQPASGRWCSPIAQRPEARWTGCRRRQQRRKAAVPPGADALPRGRELTASRSA